MLVLTRRAEQSIVIGTDIVVTVLEVRGDNVRIGIRAPRDVAVHREEVFNEIRRANEASAASPDDARRQLEELKARERGEEPDPPR
jgi:carbon storage regulator